MTSQGPISQHIKRNWLSEYSGVETFPQKMWLLTSEVQPETHKGLKLVTLMFALSDARDYSFSQVPYLEREEKITDQSNFVNNVT